MTLRGRRGREEEGRRRTWVGGIGGVILMHRFQGCQVEARPSAKGADKGLEKGWGAAEMNR